MFDYGQDALYAVYSIVVRELGHSHMKSIRVSWRLSVFYGFAKADLVMLIKSSFRHLISQPKF